jgi:RNA polymerase sigma-70 factor (ECF subfamily)
VTSLDQSDFRELFEREREPIFRFLYRLTRNATDADDLLQETFLLIWRKREQFRGTGSIEGWLRRTAFRAYLNAREKSVRRDSLAPCTAQLSTAELRDVEMRAVEPRDAGRNGCASSEAALEHRESIEYLVARVREAVDELPDGAREAFVLFRCEGWSCAEIAEATEVPLKTVETRIARATQLLAVRLRPYRSSVPSW